MLLLSIFFRNSSIQPLDCARPLVPTTQQRWEKLTSSPLACGRESHHDPDKFASRMISAFFMLSVSVSVSENGSGDSRRETTPLALIMTDQPTVRPSDGKPRGGVHNTPVMDAELSYSDYIYVNKQ